jgi:hypothetical protein
VIVKYITLILIFLSFTILSAQSKDIFSDVFFSTVSINPSSTSLALGDVTGVANLWSGDPLNVWSNPALVAYHNGLRVGYAHDRFNQNVEYGSTKYYNNSSYMSYAKNGWGAAIPMLNYNGKFGTTFDYNKRGVLYEDEEGPGLDNSYDTKSEFTVAHDILFNTRENDNRPFLQALDASIGFSLDVITARYEFYEHPVSGNNVIIQRTQADAYPFNAGVLFRFDGTKYFALQNLELQASLGWEMTNLFLAKIIYKTDDLSDYTDKLPQANRIGAALFMGLPISLLSKTTTPFTEYCPHIVTILLMDATQENTYGADENGQGIEIGMLDILFIRRGNHDYIGLTGVNTTSGLGLKLHYQKKWEFQYNAAQYNNSDTGDQYTQDLSIAYHF